MSDSLNPKKKKPLTLEEVQRLFPSPLRISQARQRIRQAHQRNNRILVVLDDDPTGTQTVHDVDVYLEWDERIIENAVRDCKDCFYISTNSRSMEPHKAAELNFYLGGLLARASETTGRKITVASRSDSTLRGHFPVEVDSLLDGMVMPIDGILIVPAFFEGGRYTFKNTHWVLGDQSLVPAHETEFASDPHFGYRHSNLCDWIADKTTGRIRAGDVQTIPLEVIRNGGIEAVAALFKKAENSRYFVINALHETDLEVVVLALIEAENIGKRFLFRCAASLVKVYAGLADFPLLTGKQIASGGPGLVVVGSYVQKTSDQLGHLLDTAKIIPFELPVRELVSEEKQPELLDTVIKNVDHALQQGNTAVLFTSRERQNLEGVAFLAFGEKVMFGLTEIVKRIKNRPAFILTKGGITSLSVAKDSLSVSRARVLGQITPGVPVWQLETGAKWPGIPYIVFPGNVGTVDTLREVITALTV